MGTDVQVIRTKHKLKAFAFAAKATKGCAASLTLALGNNTLEVCSHISALTTTSCESVQWTCCCLIMAEV